MLGRQLRNAVLGLLAVTVVCAFFLGDTKETIVIGVILVASIGLGFVNEYRAERASAAMHSNGASLSQSYGATGTSPRLTSPIWFWATLSGSPWGKQCPPICDCSMWPAWNATKVSCRANPRSWRSRHKQ